MTGAVRGGLWAVWRRPRWWLILALVLLLHLWLRERVVDELAQLGPQHSTMQRMQAVYTRQMAPAAMPTPAAPAKAPLPAAKQAAPAARPAASDAAANAPEPAASAAATADSPEAAASAASAVGDGATLAAADLASIVASPAPASAASASAVAPAASAAAASASAPAGSELLYGVVWPASTRLRYVLNGWYRGHVDGSAQVEWLRQGSRYQVHLEVSLGPAVAPLVTRRMSSEGRITPDGLAPQRYEEETRVIIGRNRLRDVNFDADGVRLDGGGRVPSEAGMQDLASQFVQVIYLLSSQPALRRAGSNVDFPLALPNRIDHWVYDIGPLAPLDTPAGVIEAMHLQPRRRTGTSDLTVQMWLAPQLQMMPVRLRIDQDQDTWADLLLKVMPDQAGPP